MSLYVTQSPLLRHEHRELLLTGEVLAVTGVPMIVWGANGEDSFYSENSRIDSMPFVARLAVPNVIDPSVNHHLESKFQGEYVVIRGENPETGDDYMFGAKDSLEFCLHSLSLIRTSL